MTHLIYDMKINHYSTHQTNSEHSSCGSSKHSPLESSTKPLHETRNTSTPTETHYILVILYHHAYVNVPHEHAGESYLNMDVTISQVRERTPTQTQGIVMVFRNWLNWW